MKLNLLLKTCLCTLTVTLLIFLFSFNRQAAQPLHILVFSKTDGFRHASIEAGKAAFTKMALKKDLLSTSPKTPQNLLLLT